MLLQRTIGVGLFIRRNAQVVHDPDFRNLYGLMRFRNIALDDRGQIVGERCDLARYQRAGKGAGQSSADRGDHMIESRGVFIFRFDAVEFRDAAMDTVGHGLFKLFDEGGSNGRYFLYDRDVAGVDDVCHENYSFFLVCEFSRTAKNDARIDTLYNSDNAICQALFAISIKIQMCFATFILCMLSDVDAAFVEGEIQD